MSPLRKKSTRRKPASREGHVPFIMKTVVPEPRLQIRKQRAVSILQSAESDIAQLLSLLDRAKDQEDLFKVIHFDFHHAVKRYGDHLLSLFKQIDESECFHIPFSKWFRHLSQMEISMGRAQSSLSYLQLAAVRKEPFTAMQKAARRAQHDLETVKEHMRSLQRLLTKG